MAKPGTDLHEGRVSIKKSVHHPGTAADLPVVPFNVIVGADSCPMLAGEIIVGQCFFNTIFHLPGILFQIHPPQLSCHSAGI